MPIGKTYMLPNIFKGQEYHVVSYIGKEYWMPDVQHTWCTEQFGKAGDYTNIVTCRWYHHGNRFGFLYTADRDWFILRWS